MTLYVNDEKIEDVVIDEEIQRLRPEYEQVFHSEDPEQIEANEKQLREWSRENVIERVLLKQAAENDPEPLDTEIIEQNYKKLIEQAGGEEEFLKQHDLKPENIEDVKKDIETDLRIQRKMARITGAAPQPTKKEIQNYFEENSDRFVIPEMVRASHIVLHPEEGTEAEQQRQKLQKILGEIREKGNFAEMAGEYSSCPDSGGDLGFFPRGQMVQEFDDVVFNMEIGQVSDVFQTPFGYHIAKVTEKRPAIPCSLDDVKEVIEKELTQEAQQKALEDFVDAEKEKATIEDK